MRVVASALIAAATLMLGAIASAPIAAAEGAAYGASASIDAYQRYCEDESYRARYWAYCKRFYAYNDDDEDAYYDDDYARDDYGAYYGGYEGYYGGYYGIYGFGHGFGRGHHEHHGEHLGDHGGHEHGNRHHSH
jgi:hypothetical protein